MKIRIQFYTQRSPASEQSPRDGRKCFSTIHAPTYNSKAPKLPYTGVHEFDLEPEHLFSDQFNASGFRLFDWYHSTDAEVSSIFRGHWVLPEDLAKLNALRAKRHVCGYCGFQTDTPEEFGGWCRKCLGSDYLKPEDLYLLRLLPINTKDSRSNKSAIPPDLLAEFERLKTEYSSRQHERLQQKRAAFIADIERKHKALDRKRDCILAIYDAGMDPSALGVVYYNHTDTLSFGAIKRLSDAEVELITSTNPDIPCAWDVKRS